MVFRVTSAAPDLNGILQGRHLPQAELCLFVCYFYFLLLVFKTKSSMPVWLQTPYLAEDELALRPWHLTPKFWVCTSDPPASSVTRAKIAGVQHHTCLYAAVDGTQGVMCARHTPYQLSHIFCKNGLLLSLF